MRVWTVTGGIRRPALAGKLDDIEMREDPVFRLGIKDTW